MADKTYASWAHGCCAVHERTTTRAVYTGFYVKFTLPANTDDWIHLPVPTPVIVQNVRARLAKVFYLFNGTGTSGIKDIHFFDGANRFSEISGVWRKGDHGMRIDDDSSTTFLTPLHDVLWGVGISLHVFSGESQSDFIVTTYGADFVYNLP